MRRAVSAAKVALQASGVLRAQASSCIATSTRLYSGESITCTLFPGDGIGPEIAEAVQKIFEASGAPIEWDEQYISKTADPRTNSMVTRENLDSVLVGTLIEQPIRFYTTCPYRVHPPPMFFKYACQSAVKVERHHVRVSGCLVPDRGCCLATCA